MATATGSMPATPTTRPSHVGGRHLASRGPLSRRRRRRSWYAGVGWVGGFYATLAPMNEQLRPRPEDRTTQAAEGLPRWRWTTAELVRLTELGAFAAEDRFELIGGEIVPMSPKGRRHELVREMLYELFRSMQSGQIHTVAMPQLNLSDDTYTEPDILVRPTSVLTPDVRGDTALLVVEIAQTSLDYDLGEKALLYARHGVRDYWVVDAATLATTVHRGPGINGYADVTSVTADEQLSMHVMPELTLRLRTLKLD